MRNTDPIPNISNEKHQIIMNIHCIQGMQLLQLCAWYVVHLLGYIPQISNSDLKYTKSSDDKWAFQYIWKNTRLQYPINKEIELT
jgi:hypothetical protein